MRASVCVCVLLCGGGEPVNLLCGGDSVTQSSCDTEHFILIRCVISYLIPTSSTPSFTAHEYAQDHKKGTPRARLNLIYSGFHFANRIVPLLVLGCIRILQNQTHYCWSTVTRTGQSQTVSDHDNNADAIGCKELKCCCLKGTKCPCVWAQKLFTAAYRVNLRFQFHSKCEMLTFSAEKTLLFFVQWDEISCKQRHTPVWAIQVLLWWQEDPASLSTAAHAILYTPCSPCTSLPSDIRVK